jgi:hypothetical protein
MTMGGKKNTNKYLKRKERRNLTKGQLMPRKYATHPIFGEDLIAVKGPPHTL